MALIGETLAEVGTIRRGAMRRLRGQYKLAELAEMFGISKQRVDQILNR
jgi:DNA-directed RNA polymerase sigma subunit (sigma70/sigma32)